MPTKDEIKYNVKKVLTKAISPWVLNPQRVLIEGFEYINLEDYDAALEKFDRVIYMTLPTWRQIRFDCFFNKGVILSNMGESRKAIESFTQAIKIYKKKSKAWIEMGMAHHELDEFDDAMVCFETGLKIDHEDPELWVLKGELLGKHMNKPEDALECYEKALKLDPENTWALLEKAEVITDMNKFDEAKKIMDYALTLDQEDSDIYVNRGYLNIKLGNLDEAISDFDKAIKIDPTNELVWYNTACGLSLLKKEEKALDALLVAVSLDPENLEKLRHEEDFSNIKNSQRFIKLLSQDI